MSLIIKHWRGYLTLGNDEITMGEIWEENQRIGEIHLKKPRGGLYQFKEIHVYTNNPYQTISEVFIELSKHLVPSTFLVIPDAKSNERIVQICEQMGKKVKEGTELEKLDKGLGVYAFSSVDTESKAELNTRGGELWITRYKNLIYHHATALKVEELTSHEILEELKAISMLSNDALQQIQQIWEIYDK